MDFENPNTTPEDEMSPEKEKVIEDTTGFEAAVAEGRLDEAETWLMEAKNAKYTDNDRWLDHRSSSLFNKYREEENWVAAKRMVELANGEDAIQGRRKALERVSAIHYDEI